MGWRINDYNGADQERISRVQQTVRNGIRSSKTGVEYLSNTVERDNIHIILRSHVSKLDIQNETVTGVYVIRDGRKYFIKAEKEVILSAGAIGSPQILMLSGVGPKQHLNELGIDVIAGLPVGRNLKDHQMVFLPTRINSSHSITLNILESLSKMMYYFFRTGPLSIAGAEGTGFFYTDVSGRGKTNIDVQFIFIGLLFHYNFYNFKDEERKNFSRKVLLKKVLPRL